MGLTGIGANVWGPRTLLAGLVVVLLVLPFFVFRHYVPDKGVYPKNMVEDMHLGAEEGAASRAGVLPYIALGAAVLCVLAGNHRAAG